MVLKKLEKYNNLNSPNAERMNIEIKIKKRIKLLMF